MHIPTWVIVAKLNNALCTRVGDGIPSLEFKSGSDSVQNAEK
jgi:hypothetical protein